MDRFGETKKAGLFGIIGNIFLLVIKGTVGFVFKSQSMIADAANSAGDIFSSLMTFIGNKIASEPKDETHNFGHGKAEYVFSLCCININSPIASQKSFQISSNVIQSSTHLRETNFNNTV